MKTYVVAITGASGVILGLRLIEELLKQFQLHVVISQSALPIITEETHIKLNDHSGNMYLHNENDMFASIASGSYETAGMFVVPCSMKTLSTIANGYSSNLISRAADVTIKEGRKLIISPREMPFNAIHLENMLKLSRLGVTIAAPIPAFYHHPTTIEDIVDFLVGKILDCMKIKHNLYQKWSGN